MSSTATQIKSEVAVQHVSSKCRKFTKQKLLAYLRFYVGTASTRQGDDDVTVCFKYIFDLPIKIPSIRGEPLSRDPPIL